MIRIAVAVAVFVAVAGAWYLLGGRGQGAAEGQRAPNFTLEQHHLPPEEGGDAAGAPETVSLASLRGKPVFINFWATWCEPCRWEMPFILEVQNSRPDVHVYAINVGESDEEVAAYLDEVGLEGLNILMDKGFEVYGEYHLTGLPTSLFLDAQGTVCVRVAGPMTLDVMQANLDKSMEPC